MGHGRFRWRTRGNVPPQFQRAEDAVAVCGEMVTEDLISRLERVTVGGETFYVKTYYEAGRHLRRYVGRSRVRAEWENLERLAIIGIPTAEVVAWGEQQHWGPGRRGLMITREIAGVADLQTLARRGDPILLDPAWVRQVACRLGAHVRRMHAANFIHNDLNWRNVLVELRPRPEVYIIDSPLGRRLPSVLRSRGVRKDLASLDRMALQYLTLRPRLAFIHEYLSSRKLGSGDRAAMLRVEAFFAGRIPAR